MKLGFRVKFFIQVVIDSINTRVAGSRDTDLRKWIQQDGFSTDFLVQCADDADETTSSLVSEANESVDRSSMASAPPQNETASQVQSPEPVQQQPSTSTPLPPMEVDQGCISDVLDELRQVTQRVEDLKAEVDAANSKILLRELEHKDLKVRSFMIIYTLLNKNF